MDEKKTTLEDRVVEFMGNHPNVTMAVITIGSLVFGVVCWKVQTHAFAKDVVKELAKKGI